MSERLRRRRRDENSEEKGAGVPKGSAIRRGSSGGSGVPQGSSGGRSAGGSGGSGVPAGSSASRGSSGGSGVPAGSGRSFGSSGGSGVPRGSSSSRGSRGGSGVPAGSSVRKGRSGGAGIPRGSKTIENEQQNKATNEGAVEQKIDPATQVQNVSDEGRVTAIISVTGVKDAVGDVIEPGAYEKTLKTRTPRGIWSHRWHNPVSRTESIKELMPGDPDLPKTLGNGEPWPEKAGAVIVDTLFNLKTDAGRQAFENVKFFSEGADGNSSEWSIGYATKRSTKGKDGTRYIQELDLYEYSPVLHGANRHAKTLSVKSLDEAVAALHLGGYDTSELEVDEPKSDDPEPDAEGLSPDEVKGLVEAHSIIGAYLDAIGVAVEGKRATVVEGDPDLEQPAERWVDSDADDGDEGPMSLYDELEQLLDPEDFADLLELAAEFDDASDEGDDEAAGEIMGDFLDEFEGLESQDSELSALRDVIADVIDDRYPELAEADDEDDDLAEDDDAYYDESEEDESEDEGDADDVDDSAEDAGEADAGEKSAYWVKEIPKSKRDEMAKRGTALRDGSYPIGDAGQLQSAIRLRTQGNAPNKVVDDHIKKRANALNLSHMLPDSMTAGNKKKPSEKSAALSEVKALPSMSWGSEEASSLVLSAIDWNN